MLNYIIFTNVPKADVIMLAYGLRDSPKSATFPIHFPYLLIKNTFNDFKSRCITGGFIRCKNYIPFAISIAIESLYFHDNPI
jgi:hypothetical protein